MEQLAAPGSVTITATTLHLAEGLVQVNNLGPIPVKGISKPIDVYELTRASTTRRSLQAAAARGLAKFVGRETEIETLTQAYEQAKMGHGQVVAAVGEAGVGKSRLAYEFIHSHRTQGWLVLESASVSYGKATPYFPLVDLLRHYVHVEEGDDARTVRAKVTGHILTLDEGLQETIPALLSLLDALPEDSPFFKLEPAQRRQQTLDGLKRILLRESQVQPLLLIFEDLHWIDSETQALLDRLIDSLPTAHLLLLLSYRPEYQHPWGSKSFYTQLRLDPLPPASADAFLQNLLGNDPALASLNAFLIERTEGNPFFLQESIRTLMETQVLAGEPGAYRLTRELPDFQVPATVQAILAARIDRLPLDEKWLLQTAAVIGSEIPLPLLQSIAELPQDALYRSLTHLQAAEFLYETNLFPEHIYTFKHALTHEVAYSSLLQERRRVLHARIVEALEALSGNRLVEQVERLKHHAFRGEVWDKALLYLQQAGAKAMQQSAHREAAHYYEQALEALEHLPKAHEILEQAIDLRFSLSTALIPQQESDRALNALREAASLAEALDDRNRLGHAFARMVAHLRSTGDYEEALTYGQRAHDIAVDLGDFSLQVVADFIVGQTYHLLGNYQRAITFFHQAVAALEPDQLYAHFGWLTLPPIQCRVYLVWSLLEVGAFVQGIVHSDAAIRIAEAADRPYDRLTAYIRASTLHLRRGDVRQATTLLERSLSLIQAANLSTSYSLVAAPLALAYARCGRTDEALMLLKQVMTQTSSTFICLFCIEAYLLANQVKEAGQLALPTLARTRQRDEQGHEAWVLWLLGEIAIHRGPGEAEQAEIHYQQALTLAKELDMRPLQARCHHGLGTLYQQTERSATARHELSKALEMYRDMEMTFWLPETEAALAKVTRQ
jgi:tetratricopeptide (TPR) repeat protein